MCRRRKQSAIRWQDFSRAILPAPRQIMHVASHRRKFRPAAELLLQVQNAIVFGATRNATRQVVRKDAYTSLSNQRQRGRIQHGVQVGWVKESHRAFVQRLNSPLSREICLRSRQVALLDCSLED